MIERQKRIFREIVANYFGVSILELSKITNVSDKTILSDIKELESILKDYNLSFIKKDSIVSIPFEEKKSFSDAYQQITTNEDKDKKLSEQADREIGILIYLAGKQKYVSMDSIADNFYYSKATVYTLVHELKDHLEKATALKLEISSRKGIRLHGTEAEIRKALSYIFSKPLSIHVVNRYLINYLDDDLLEKSAAVSKRVNQYLSEKHIHISEERMTMITLNTLITAQRLRDGYHLNMKFENHSSLIAGYCICLKDAGLEIPENELLYLLGFFVGEKDGSGKLSYQIVKGFIEQTNLRYHHHILHMSEAENLISHVELMLKDGLKRSELRDFAMQNMYKKFFNAYIMAGPLCREIESNIHIEVDDENRCYLAMYIQTMIRNHIWLSEDVLLYEPNNSIRDLMTANYEKHFGERIKMTSVKASSEIEKQLAEKEYSLILATRSMPAYFNGVPFLKVSPFANDEDYKKTGTILYRYAPFKMTEGKYNHGSIDISENHLQIESDFVTIDKYLFATSVSSYEPSEVIKTEANNKELYVFNYNIDENIGKYILMVNNFGQNLFCE